MGTTGATFVRFGFGLPFALLFVAFLHLGRRLRAAVPERALSSAGRWSEGSGQIGATFLLIHLFSFRNFAVGTAYSRTEPAQAALFGLIFLGERASLGAIAGHRHQRFRRDADLGRACRRELAHHAVLDDQPQRPDRPRLRHAVRHLGRRLPRRVAVARRAELPDAGGGDAGLRHHLPDDLDAGLDAVEGSRRASAASPRPGSRRCSPAWSAPRPRSAGSRR